MTREEIAVAVKELLEKHKVNLDLVETKNLKLSYRLKDDATKELPVEKSKEISDAVQAVLDEHKAVFLQDEIESARLEVRDVAEPMKKVSDEKSQEVLSELSEFLKENDAQLEAYFRSDVGQSKRKVINVVKEK